MIGHAQFHSALFFLLESEPVPENTRSLLLKPGSWLYRKAMKDVPPGAMTKWVTLTSCEVPYSQVHLSHTRKDMPSTKTLPGVASWCRVVPCSGLV